MKFFTKKELREHDCQIIDEMMDKRFMTERMERLENRMMELEMRMGRIECRAQEDVQCREANVAPKYK